MSIKKVMTLAGSDTSGGAGIQADLKTFQELGVYGMTALTTIVTMKPEGWHHEVHPLPVETLKKQLDTILSVGIDAMKTGMLGTVEIIELAAKVIKEHKLDKVVIDPVMVCKGEDEVLNPETTDAMRELLVPVSTVVTPNLFEAGQLAKTGPIRTMDQLKEAAATIHDQGAKYVVIKGGSKFDYEGEAIDLLYDGKNYHLYRTPKIGTTYTHGAGCTYSSAIAAGLAKGLEVQAAIDTAKLFITEAIREGFQLNEYVGPTWQGAYRKTQNS
ncbi:bifunctional hydroxymethylpyrimidine kinase/phosphomethylpyrimidine kinase [Bacillus sp. FJAT-27225]|uniref:pyridoxine/pyridoxal/pyridoxamine kinase n=1 Tax=Bacillus sp. FJAT-27225 TaxID=1743144 RepID=UPI00080C2E5C|nr:pyridoxine/pyridoxal/pyridoxamine kinase [Bacillus sp. FJAT-27225]OCA82328.1 bifunctional hydroxymethylpyrimidine kinase/phosphomethylpyrimidine kinase [Bacillus sp. FJAT-27225]